MTRRVDPTKPSYNPLIFVFLLIKKELNWSKLGTQVLEQAKSKNYDLN